MCVGVCECELAKKHVRVGVWVCVCVCVENVSERESQWILKEVVR